MLLCDAVQVAEGKLYILGGGWSLTGPGPSPCAVAMKIEVDWNEAQDSHSWELAIEDADGQPVLIQTPQGEFPVKVNGEFQVNRPLEAPKGSPADVALAVNFGPLPLNPGGRFIWRLSIDGISEQDWTVAFTTRSAFGDSPPGGTGGGPFWEKGPGEGGFGGLPDDWQNGGDML